MRNPRWFAGWRRGAFKELVEKNQRLKNDFNLGKWTRYDYDLSQLTMKFSDQGNVKVVAEIQVAGTVAQSEWLWAWANPGFPPDSIADAALVREFGRQNLIRSLTKEYIGGAGVEGTGWEMSGVMVRITNALGAYRAPTRSGGLIFFTIKRIGWVS